MNTIKLVDHSEDQINAAVAEHVAGWKRHDPLGNGNAFWSVDGFHVAGYAHHFTRSADAVLGLLEKWCGEKEFNGPSIGMAADGEWIVSLHDGMDGLWSAKHKVLPTAISLALLRSKGISVEFTGEGRT